MYLLFQSKPNIMPLLNHSLRFHVLVTMRTLILLLGAIVGIPQMLPQGFPAEQTLSTNHADETIPAGLHLHAYRVHKGKA